MSDNNRNTSSIAGFCNILGLHPIVGFGMFAIDQLIFGMNMISMGFLIPVSIIIGILMTFAAILIQKSGTPDGWGMAIGKGIMVGIITAIPTSISSICLIPSAVLGTIGMLMNNRQNSNNEPKCIKN